MSTNVTRYLTSRSRRPGLPDPDSGCRRFVNLNLAQKLFHSLVWPSPVYFQLDKYAFVDPSPPLLVEYAPIIVPE